ncbi:DUF3883 domain-containing protein [Hansschlegelia quercus]|uniref:DUF3883 domain-containing protein n=1 Tax=Hansschlegelia quercus TaxID=2528245 RepID=UPI001FE0058A|nr:DUF3883 domain-containing protein [Hansschlegelia quercus]
MSEEDGDGAGYDIRSFDLAGRERLIEVKTTVGQSTTPFFLSESERAFTEERPDAFRIARLYDFARQPRAFELAPPLDKCMMLRPATCGPSFSHGAICNLRFQRTPGSLTPHVELRLPPPRISPRPRGGGRGREAGCGVAHRGRLLRRQGSRGRGQMGVPQRPGPDAALSGQHRGAARRTELQAARGTSGL